MLQALKNSIKTNLKGDYKSVDKRLSTQVDKLVVLFYRLIGRSWIDYYADRLDANAGKDLGDDYLDGANVHLQYLQAHGLPPDHVVQEEDEIGQDEDVNLKFCEKVLEFFIDLLSQAITRRYFFYVLQNNHFVVFCKLTPIIKSQKGISKREFQFIFLHRNYF